MSDGPENVLSVHEDTAGSHANLTAGEINRLLTTQLPAAATTAACQPRQMHDSHISSTDTDFFYIKYKLLAGKLVLIYTRHEEKKHLNILVLLTSLSSLYQKTTVFFHVL